MSNLQRLAVDSLGNLNFTDALDSFRTFDETLVSDLGFQTKQNMMSSTEIKIAIRCAMNIKKHLTRALQRREDAELESKLQYVNNLIREVGLKASI